MERPNQFFGVVQTKRLANESEPVCLAARGTLGAAGAHAHWLCRTPISAPIKLCVAGPGHFSPATPRRGEMRTSYEDMFRKCKHVSSKSTPANERRYEQRKRFVGFAAEPSDSAASRRG